MSIVSGEIVQTVTIRWMPVEDMPDEEGTYLVAFSDGTVESFPMDTNDLISGKIRTGEARGEYWAKPIPHPNA